MPATCSPLRYPGGKTQLASFVKHTIDINNIKDGIYCEPFSGGAGVAIKLLLSDAVESIILNDIDIGIFSVWKAIIEDTKNLVALIETTPVTIDEWHCQKEKYENLKTSGDYSLALGFSTLFLNRCNRAGIISGGPIGGHEQLSKYKIDCRFTKSTLIEKIKAIAKQKERISLYNLDAKTLVEETLACLPCDKLFVFFDPPYYKQGNNLYTNCFDHENHMQLKDAICALERHKWIVTYDNAPEIGSIYHNVQCYQYYIGYSANQVRRELEYLFYAPQLSIESFGNVQLQ